MKNRFFSVKQARIVNGKGCLPDVAYEITASNLPEVNVLVDNGIAVLYENKPDFSIKPVAVVEKVSAESVLGKKPKVKAKSEEEGNSL